MSTFKTSADLKKEILRRSTQAVASAKQRVYEIIDNSLHDYYADFGGGFSISDPYPSSYIRTKQLLHSLVQDEVKTVGNKVTAEVYFDASKLNYKNGVMELKHTPETGIYGWATWGAEEVLDTSMKGLHGGQHQGTAIWPESLAKIDKHYIDILKESLIACGVPVK